MLKRLIFIVMLVSLLGCKRSTYPMGNIKDPTDKPSYDASAQMHPAPTN